MRTTWVFFVLTLLGLTIPLTASAQTSSYGSVQITPAYQEVSAGAQVSFTVSASSTAGGDVSVAIQPGLTLVGDPSCNGPCPGFDIRRRTDGTFFNVNVYGAVTIQLTLTVSPSSGVGDQIAINATLVGGTRTVEMSSAMVLVTAAASTIESGNSRLPDNRQAYLSVYPEAARIPPSGQVLYFIQPIFLGQWEGDFPAYSVEVNIPVGMSPLFEPYCGERSSTIPMQFPCDATLQKNIDGSSTISTSPGYSAGDTNGVYLILKTDSGLEPDSSLSLSFNMTVTEITGIGQPELVRSNVIVVDESLLLTPQSTGAVSGMIEIASVDIL